MTANPATSFEIQDYIEDKHRNFILDSWLQSYKLTRLGRHSEREDYYPIQESIIKSILKDATVKLAVSDGAYMGYIVIEGTCLHYLYVKHALRRFGVATRLLDEFPGLKCFSTFIDTHWKNQWLHHRRGLGFSYYKSLKPSFTLRFDGPVYEVPIDELR